MPVRMALGIQILNIGRFFKSFFSYPVIAYSIDAAENLELLRCTGWKM